VGTAQTNYGFTGEYGLPGGLLHLRARNYQPGLGVFTALDPFEGMMGRPMSLNGYGWVEGNVINRIDPSGLCAGNIGEVDDLRSPNSSCWRRSYELFKDFGVVIDISSPSWTSAEVQNVYTAMSLIALKIQTDSSFATLADLGANSMGRFRRAFVRPLNYIHISKLAQHPFGSNTAVAGFVDPQVPRVINLIDGIWNSAGSSSPDLVWTIIHEFAHILDLQPGLFAIGGSTGFLQSVGAKVAAGTNDNILSSGIDCYLGSQSNSPWGSDYCFYTQNINENNYLPGTESNTDYGRTSPAEDLAESFAAYVTTDYYSYVGLPYSLTSQELETYFGAVGYGIVSPKRSEYFRRYFSNWRTMPYRERFTCTEWLKAFGNSQEAIDSNSSICEFLDSNRPNPIRLLKRISC
jgi:RHS repeat-associated protein